MYAIVDIAGQQFKVEKDQKLHVHRLDAEEGSHVEFGTVFFTSDKGKATVGAPKIDGARVAAKVISHEKGDKVLVFHKKRRKGYQKLNGHRQSLTEIVIEGILAKGAKGNAKAKLLTWDAEAAPAPKKKAAVAVKPAPAAKKAAPKAEKETPKAAAPKASGKDDLKKIEGIGPKIASVLGEAGIVTFADLAAAKSENISELIADVRGNHVTETWPAQAQLAADGKWDELKKWQDELDGGKS